MDRLTNAAQGYCEVYCQKFGRCFAEPGECIRQGEIAMYERLKEYEIIGLTPELIEEMRADANTMARELKAVTAERYLLLRQLHDLTACDTCKHEAKRAEEEPCNNCMYGPHYLAQEEKDNWEWRGAEDTNVPSKTATNTNVTTKEED